MRDPDLLHKAYELEVPQGVLTIDNVPEYRVFDYDLLDDKSYKKFIDDVEKDARNSFEYKQMVAYLREYTDMNQCAFFQNVSNVNTTKIRIEIHHEPVSLYDIATIISRKRMEMQESMEIEDVSREIMYIHYSMMVGLIPLAETVHELVHNQYLFIPTNNVFGKYREFLNRYDKWVTPEQRDIIDRIEDLTVNGGSDEEYKDILSRHYIYINMKDEQYKKHTLDSTLGIIKDRISEILKV